VIKKVLAGIILAAFILVMVAVLCWLSVQLISLAKADTAAMLQGLGLAVVILAIIAAGLFLLGWAVNTFTKGGGHR